jgi:hypothetical protein
VFVQTFGDLLNFNSHLHVLAADGAFIPGGRFVALPRVPASLLAEGFRRAVLDFLVENEALSEEFRGRMLAFPTATSTWCATRGGIRTVRRASARRNPAPQPPSL